MPTIQRPPSLYHELSSLIESFLLSPKGRKCNDAPAPHCTSYKIVPASKTPYRNPKSLRLRSQYGAINVPVLRARWMKNPEGPMIETSLLLAAFLLKCPALAVRISRYKARTTSYVNKVGVVRKQ